MDTLRQAVAAHMKGDLRAAQMLYGQAIEEYPDDGDELNEVTCTTPNPTPELFRRSPTHNFKQQK